MSEPDAPPSRPVIPRDIRIDYGKDELLESTIVPDPIQQFRRWFEDALSAKVVEPNAMSLATVDASGQPTVRIVLLKEFDERGFVFYTNYGSRKGRELENNPRAGLCVYWQPMERQVRIDGRVERVSRAESEAYFHSRPLAAQIGAWASAQSEVIPSREALEERVFELMTKYIDEPVPLPEFWGGYRVVPHQVEFWQGRPSRLHDRIRYRRERQEGQWTIERLSP